MIFAIKCNVYDRGLCFSLIFGRMFIALKADFSSFWFTGDFFTVVVKFVERLLVVLKKKNRSS